MTLNLQTFKTRSLTASVFVMIMLLGLLWNYPVFLILFTLIHFGCWYEFVKLLKRINEKKYLGYSQFGLAYISLPVMAIVNLAIKREFSPIDQNFKVIFSNIIPCAIIFSIWINDTMAYIVGSWIGKTPFSKISPKKTWEGTIGGLLLCILVIGLLAYFTKLLTVKDAVVIAAISSIFGTLGDLFESKLKRMANVKDSGSFMPGHGGFLDRFDSFLIATPFVWLYVRFFL